MVIKSETTKKNYDGFLRRLRAGLSTEGTAFLEDHKKVCDWIEAQPLSDNSKKAYYTAVKATLREEGKYADAQKEYDVKFKALAEKLYEQSKKQELTPKEEEKYLSWDDILKVRDALEPKEDETDVFKFQDWVILCLYTMMPPLRADFAPMKVYPKKPKKDEGNYLILPAKGTAKMVLNEYKTRSTFGRVERPLPKALADILRGFKTFQPTEWLIVKEDGEPMSADNLSQRVIRIFERNAKKPLGISMMRHSYITKMRSGKELTLLEKEQLATAMLHSTLTNELYRRPSAE